jgi:hypothetical protein
MPCHAKVMRRANRRHRPASALVFCASLLGSAAAAAGEEPQAGAADRAQAAAMDVQVEHGRLSLRVDGAPLAEVLRAIGEAAGFPVVLDGMLATPVSQSLTDEPLEDALRRLLGTNGMVVVRRHEADENVSSIAEIRVVARPGKAPPEAAATEPPARELAAADGDEAPWDRARFRQAHLDLRWPPSKEDILVELAEPDLAARVAAVPKVAVLEPREAVRVLSDIVAEEPDQLVRSRAIAALARLGTADAAAVLTEQALGNDDGALRMQALNGLTASARERAVTVVGRALRRDSEARVRSAAIHALERIGGNWARGYLERATQDRDPAIATAAERALQAWSGTPR